MLTATVTDHGGSFTVVVAPQQGDETESTTEVKEGPSPIAPELKELAWTSGAFVVFAILMRYILVPRVRKGMEARYNKIRGDISGADAARAAARSEVAEYERQLAAVRAEAAARVDAARQELESERRGQLATANTRLAQERAAAAEQDEAALTAVRDQIQAAVADVVTRAVEIGTGTRPNSDTVNRAVQDAMSVGATR